MESYIEENINNYPWHELANGVNKEFGTKYNADSLRKWCARRHIYKSNTGGVMPRKPRSADEDLVLHRAKTEKSEVDKKYKALLKRIAELEDDIESYDAIKPISTRVIKPKFGKKTGEATAVVVASDWHIEENVRNDLVSGKNEYTVAIARERATEFFQAVLRLTEICGKDVNINHMVLALLGDFISGDIHEELLETCELTPVEAIIEAKNLIASGIEFLLANSNLTFTIPCHSGNHARTTQKSRHSTEAGHSLEYAMYHYLADHFRAEKRVQFLIPRGYHSFVRVYDTRIRFHHGHNIRYGGGVGGLTIPVNKAIAQWNKTEWADLDVFGHFHQRFDGGNFLCNGSMIGFNAYAVSIKAGFEKPTQTFFLIDKKRGKTCVWPIMFSK